MNWFRKNRDWLITLAVFLIFILLLTLYSVFRKDKEGEILPPKVEKEATFELPTNEQVETADTADKKMQTTSFFLRPSAKELLHKLENLNHQEFRKETRELPGLRVMWPAYFFSATPAENGKAEVLLDADKSGFGVTLLTTIDTTRYPQILTLKRGTKLWLAAEITGVDPAGTGQFLLSTEYVRFDDYQPLNNPPDKEKKSQTQ